jgi:hypothetical protein
VDLAGQVPTLVVELVSGDEIKLDPLVAGLQGYLFA